MKIKAGIENNTFNCFNEAREIAKNKKRVLRNKKVNVWPFWGTKLLVFAAWLVLSLILLLNKYIFLANMIIFLDICYLILAFLRVFLSLSMRKSDLELTFNKEGIVDESYMGIKMTFKWSKIKAVVLGEYAITILTDTPFYLFLGISKKKEVKEALKKYGKDSLIIN